MNPCGPVTIEIGPVLAVLMVQALTLAGTIFAARNARLAAATGDKLEHGQGHIKAQIDALGALAPEMHKE